MVSIMPEYRSWRMHRSLSNSWDTDGWNLIYLHQTALFISGTDENKFGWVNAASVLTMGFLKSLGLMQRMKYGWQAVSVFIRESRDWRNWPVRVGTRFFASVACCQAQTNVTICNVIFISKMILELKRGRLSLTRRLLVAAVITILGLTLSLFVPVDSSFWNASLRSLLVDDSTSWIRSVLRVSRFFSRKPQNETDTIRTPQRTCTGMVPCF